MCIRDRSNGETLSIADQFLELEREGKVCLYEHLRDIAEEVYGQTHLLFARLPHGGASAWNSIDHECGKMTRAFASLVGGIRGVYGMPYGDTYYRAELPKNYVMVPHELTAEEASRRNEEEIAMAKRMQGLEPAVFVAGQIEMVRDERPKEKVRIEWIGEQWVDLFIAEVLHLLGREPEPAYIAAFDELRRNLKAFQIGDKEGAPVMERMRKEGNGVEVLAAFERCRSRLLQRLDDIAAEQATGTPAPLVNDQRIVWEGTIASFACIVRDMVAKGWITPPTDKAGDISFDLLAERMRALFYINGNGGKEASFGSLKGAMNKVDGGVTTQWNDALKCLPPVDAYRGRDGGKSSAEVSTGTPQK